MQRSALCRSRRALSMSLFLNLLFETDSYSNEYLLAKIGVTASIQPRTSPSKFWGKFNSIFIRVLRHDPPVTAFRSYAERRIARRTRSAPGSTRSRSAGQPALAAAADGQSALKLKGSIGEGSNHSNFSHQSSVKILSKFNAFR